MNELQDESDRFVEQRLDAGDGLMEIWRALCQTFLRLERDEADGRERNPEP